MIKITEKGRKNILRILNTYRGYYKEDSNEIMDIIYVDCLQDYDVKDISQAFKLHAIDPKCGSFMPKVADLMRYLKYSDESKEKTRASKAFECFLKASKRFGVDANIEFSEDPAIIKTIKNLGGWAMCMSLSKDEKSFLFFKRSFAEQYKIYSETDNNGVRQTLVYDRSKPIIDCSKKENWARLSPPAEIKYKDKRILNKYMVDMTNSELDEHEAEVENYMKEHKIGQCKEKNRTEEERNTHNLNIINSIIGKIK